MEYTFMTNIDKQELTKRIEPTPTDEIYFDITDDGLISLKPEYRGVGNTSHPYSISDTGLGNTGSNSDKLPERVVIPESVRGIKVTGYQDGMFCQNHRIKELVLSNDVKILPSGFCRAAKYLESIENTEHIEEFEGDGRHFAQTRITKAIFPSLRILGDKTISSKSVFNTCVFLREVVMGREVDWIPHQAFRKCTNLISIKGGESVTSIGDYAFENTRSLSYLDFLNNEFSDNSIGALAFVGSKIHLDDWSRLANAFKEYSPIQAYGYPTKHHEGNKFWSDFTLYDESKGSAHQDNLYSYKPCRNKIISSFDTVSGTESELYYFDKVIYKPAGVGSSYASCVSIYSAITGVEINSLKEFETTLRSKLTESNLNIPDTADECKSYTHRKERYTSLGLTAELYDKTTSGLFDKEDMKRIYDTLFAGGYVEISRIFFSSTVKYESSVVLYGVNSRGEVLVLDSTSETGSVEIHEAQIYTLPLQNLIDSKLYYITVTKPETTN